MNIKQYSNNGVTYFYSPIYRKWAFQTGNTNLIQACNGVERAHKVANIVAGSIKRSNSLDGMARSQISRLGI